MQNQLVGVMLLGNYNDFYSLQFSIFSRKSNNGIVGKMTV
jgi:hypothetical protein